MEKDRKSAPAREGGNYQVPAKETRKQGKKAQMRKRGRFPRPLSPPTSSLTSLSVSTKKEIRKKGRIA